ncbi:hypothetical protein ACNKHX_20950 [Shigella flexneri]
METNNLIVMVAAWWMVTRRAAAGRGLSVLMLEGPDFACATSSASSKPVHGGLRYLRAL